jgi:hypothetical protein
MSEAETTFTECYVAFLDLMGVRSLVEKCGHDPELYKNVIAALAETNDIGPIGSERRDLTKSESKRWVLQVQAFSDSVILFIPTETKLLSFVLAAIQRLHDRLLELNVPLRGAITIGGMHWDHRWSNDTTTLSSQAPIAFGPGLVAAYDLESTEANYPRILISDDLVRRLNGVSLDEKAFPLGKGTLNDYCRMDSDGRYHLDVLHPQIYRKDVGSIQSKNIDDKTWMIHNTKDIPLNKWYSKVRTFICSALESMKDENLRAKYLWLARYYNSAVDKAVIGEPIRLAEAPVPSRAIETSISPNRSTERNEF